MKVGTSPLQIVGFDVIDFDQKIVYPTDDKDGPVPFDVDLGAYKIDVDYDHFGGQEDNDFRIDMTIKINRVKDKAFGYSLKMSCVGAFHLKGRNKLEDNVVGNLMLFSAVNIMISSARGYLRTVTSYGPFGPYTLPSVDMSKLIKSRSPGARAKKK